MDKIRVLVVDENPVSRSRTISLVERRADFQVVGEAVSGQDALRKASQARPQVVLVSVTSILQAAWLGFCDKLARESRTIRAVLTVRGEDATQIHSLLDAAASVIERPVSKDRITIMSSLGEMAPPPITDLRHIAEVRGVEWTKPQPTKVPRLSQREREVLLLLADGYSNREIAERIFRSVKTVETYRANIKKKLGIRNRADIVRYAREGGLRDRPA